jgi:hypothetical protein
MAETLIFLHIAKAGGTTFEHLLARHYPPGATYALDNWDTLAAIQRLKNTPPADLAHVRLLKGHMPFGLHEYLPGPARYITFLRHPVERLLSMYYFIQRTPEHYLYEAVTGQGLTVEQFVRSGLSPELDNAQVKAISGNFTHYGQCTRADLEQAQRNVEQWFEVVGITERYDESLLLMRRALRWRGWPTYKRANVTAQRPAAKQVPASALAAIRDVNALDMELYEWAAGRLERQIRAAGAGFAAQLAAFKLMQRLRG